MIAGLVAFGLVLQPPGTWPTFVTSNILAEFGLGMIGYAVVQRGWALPPFGDLATLTVELLLTCLAAPYIANGLSNLIGWGISSLLIFLALRGMEEQAVEFKKTAANRFLVSMGDASYHLYLVRPFALVASAALLTMLLGTTNPYFFFNVLISAAVASGLARCQFIENPLTGPLRNHYQSVENNPAQRI